MFIGDFSVVITTKNRQDFLLRLVKSILASTVLPKEIIIVNDGGIEPVFKDVDMGGASCIIINNQFSLGANYCRNAGVLKASVEFVFLIDDDDAVTQDSFESRLSCMKEYADCGLVYTGINIVYDDNLEHVIRMSVATPRGNNCSYHMLKTEGNIVGSTSRVLIRKSVFLKAGMFDEKLSSFQDYDLWIRVAKISNIFCDGQFGVIYTIHRNGNQISSNYNRYLDSARYLICKYHFDGAESNAFKANLLFRVALSAAHSKYSVQVKMALLAFYYKKNFKYLSLLLPVFILKKIHPFI
ncbi:glycosyltransferase family 2 protein [Shewanella sp. SM23]|uniref:glycosyltransferase family 2 protein n=1 Tax=Shewanella sp. SM23 TaxID=2912794 RepID=UPI0021D9CF9A|nr:glycosyltransferase family A protein [Shewanella sp. SM23]MCU8082684.1 glycosyltransferase family 2 protein [Shewanella sp. SM23]